MKDKPASGETAGIVREFLRTQQLAGLEEAGAGDIRNVFSVQVSSSAENGQMGITDVSNGKTATLKYTRLDLRSMLSEAYGISGLNIEIASVLPEKRFDFLVQVPKASEDLIKPLLRQAIKSVYGAGVRRVKKEKQVLLLRCGKSAAQPGLSWAAAIGSCICGLGQILSTGIKMRALAGSLEGEFGMPVLDETGLDGIYRITLEWTGGSRESLAAALKDQLGLLLVLASRSMDTLEAFPAGAAGGDQASRC